MSSTSAPGKSSPSMLTGGCDFAAAGANTYFFAPNLWDKAAVPFVVEGPLRCYFSSAGTLRNLRVYFATIGPGSSAVVTVRKNGAASLLTVTLADPADPALVSDLVNQVSVAAGDYFTISIATGAAGTIDCTWALEFIPT